jgi:S1-C subfamily serine protease
MKRTSRRTVNILLLGLTVAALSGCGVCGCPVLSPPSRGLAPTPDVAHVEAQPTPLAPDIIAAADAEEQLLINLYKRIIPAIVHIRVTTLVDAGDLQLPTIPGMPDPPEDGFYQQGTGSGFLIDREGHIVTNNHVVEGAEDIQVTFHDGTVRRADVIGTDPDSDLAVAKVTLDAGLQSIVPVELADSDQVEIGQRAIALGNPFGLRGSLTTGVVSALGRSLPLGRASLTIGARFSIPELIQTDAAINPGNSGGPLLDSLGRVIGINTAYDPEVFGVGFAVPVNTIRRVVPKLIAVGRYAYPWLGISGSDLSIEIVEEMGLPVERGAIVHEITPDSPAEKVGLRGSTGSVERLGRETPIGGDVIIAIDDREVAQFEDLLVYLLRHTEVGQEVQLTIIRGGHEQVVSVELAERPGD